MSTSPSDYDMSDSSCSGASYMTNSPLYQVPQVPTKSPDMPCGTQSFLRIIAQPQNRFRFRYVSELAGTHGCLLSNSAATNSMKSYPSVELVNYTDKALIRCTLAQHNNSLEHPHRLHDEDDRDVSQIVPEQGSYMVGFRGLGIIHTAQQEIKKKCKKMAKGINFNIVRLKFSAHDVQTDKEICAPVFSEPIFNMKSAATNNLKIVRMSRFSGSPSGGDDVFIFVEKVNKKHVSICFFELDETGKRRIWEGVGQFTPSDVHHQYAIAFRTPAYRDRKSPVDVKVYIELVRTTDGHKSEPVEFKYKAEEFYKQVKRRKTNSSNRFNNIPLGTVKQNPVTTITATSENPVHVFSQPQQLPGDTSQIPELPSMFTFNEFLYPENQDLNEGDNANVKSETGIFPGSDPLLGSENYVLLTNEELPHLADLDLNDVTNLANLSLQNIDHTEVMSTFDKDEYLRHFHEMFPDDILESLESQSATLVSDSGVGYNIKFESDFGDNFLQAQGCSHPIVVKTQRTGKKYKLKLKSDEYNAFYKAEDGIEVKKLIKELCGMIKDKKGFKKQEIRERLELLFEKRLSNGDMFLHMSVYSDPACVYSIVKMIDIVKATHLLNYSNYKLQTTLHLAILNDMSQIVSLLVTKGADPMLKDDQEYNAIHYAVKSGFCLQPLLEAIKKNNVTCNINDYNGEKQSALHMAVIGDSGRSARLLLQHGASYSVRDEYGRTPLHLAAYDDSIEVTQALLDFIPQSDVDVTDNSGNTALQIVCGGTIRENSVLIIRLLLEKKANPMKTENGNESAWRLVKNKLALKAVLWDYIPTEFKDDHDVDEDVFLSADEGETSDDITST
ncbi:unnamed protein product [Arctia plantaginis]|uniref:RHD domain-containing protein n=1 Tax=Arctia plantaginis TaxID=874455 RepID=A0A8S0ZTA0_ARCPL|nr:unnamed protein product [Arctia plantaginis]